MLVLTSTGEFLEDKLLGQTESHMQAHVDPEIFEYKPSTAIGFWVVSIGKGT